MINNEKTSLFECRNNENNIIPTGLCPPRCYTGYYQDTVPMALWKMTKLAGSNEESR
jgi:hypothetical protein